MKKLLNSSLLVASAFAVFAPAVNAEPASQFTSCLTPTGSIIANYNDGDHGIIGMGNKIGKDVVYSLPNSDAMQCFCGSDGQAVQTNWMKTTSLSDDQIKVYQSQGWIYVPSGASWGLEDCPYLAQNISYTCKESSSTPAGDGKTDGRSDGRTDGKSDGMGSIVQSSTGTNLASTGNLLFIAEIFVAGVILTLVGLFLRLRSK